MIRVDGSFGEGGGQILRYAALFSAAYGEKVEVYNIRVKRPNPGLRPQHATLLRIMKKVFGGSIEGLSIGSKKVVIEFSNIKPVKGEFNIHTAGSISLILQALIPPLLLAEDTSEFIIKGGTDVKWSPPIDYMKEVYVRLVNIIGGDVSIKVIRRGFYPRGGGVVKVTVNPSKLKGWSMYKRASVDKIVVHNTVCKLPKHILRRQASKIVSLLKEYNLPVATEFHEELCQDSLDPGTVIVIIGLYDNGKIASGGDALGEKGKPAEKVAEEAFKKFKRWYKEV